MIDVLEIVPGESGIFDIAVDGVLVFTKSMIESLYPQPDETSCRCFTSTSQPADGRLSLSGPGSRTPAAGGVALGSARPEDALTERREQAGDEERSTPWRRGDEGGEPDRRSDAGDPEHRLLEAEGCTARSRAGHLCRCDEREAIPQCFRSAPATIERRDEDPRRSLLPALRRPGEPAVTTSASRRSGTIREPRRSDQWPAKILKAPPSTWEAASASPRRCRW